MNYWGVFSEKNKGGEYKNINNLEKHVNENIIKRIIYIIL